jgi:hypothetical protein
MSGSAEVNAKLTAIIKGMEKSFTKAMDTHIKHSEKFAKTEHRWTDQTSAATGGIMSGTDKKAASIISLVYGTVETNIYLEEAWFFQGRYKILEQARTDNIYILFSELRAIARGGGYGFRM